MILSVGSPSEAYDDIRETWEARRLEWRRAVLELVPGAYRDGHSALRTHQYQRAWDCFERSFRYRPISGRDNTLLKILRALFRVEGVDKERAATLRAGLERLQAMEQ